MPIAALPKPSTSAAVIKAYRPSAEEAERRVRNEAFVPVPCIAKLLGVSAELGYAAVKDGTIPSVRIGSKIRVPTKSYRELLPPAPTAPQHEAA